MIIHIGSSDHDIAARSDIEAISIMASLGIASRVINGHISNSQAVRATNADGLNGRVLDVEISDGGVDKIMSIEELGLRLAAIASLAIPPAGTIGVQICTRGAFNSDPRALNLEQWADPFFVAPGGLAFEDDLQIVSMRQQLECR